MERGKRKEQRPSQDRSRRDGVALPSNEGERDSGVTKEVYRHFKIHVSSASGYLCHISSEAHWHCPPSTIFAILINPDNSSVFRDIKAMGFRKVVQDKPQGYRVIEVEHQGEVKILWKKHKFSTFLTVIEDSRDGNALTTAFTLIGSEVLAKFQGTWTLRPGPLEGSKQTTCAVLEQDVLPKGVPAFIAHMPVLGPILRGICVRTVRRLFEDIEAVIQKSQKGVPLADALNPGQKLESHAIDMSESDEETL